VGIYLWTMLTATSSPTPRPRHRGLHLAPGADDRTGSLFGFLIARELYGTAMLAPMFIIMCSPMSGHLPDVLAAAYAWTGRALGDAVMMRLKSCCGVRRACCISSSSTT